MYSFSSGLVGRVSNVAVACSIALPGCFDGGTECPAILSTGYNVFLACPSALSVAEVDGLLVRIRPEGDGDEAWQICPVYESEPESMACGGPEDRRIIAACVHGHPTDDGMFTLDTGGQRRVAFELEASMVDAAGRAWHGASRAVWRRTSAGCSPMPEVLNIEMAPSSSP
jgi:hypothetical protein